MKGYTIQHSIDLLEKQVKGGGSGGSTAADITYDNTGSGLTADDVQEAIDEVVSMIPTNPGLELSTTEKVIGKYLDKDLYAKVVLIEAFPSTANTYVDYPHGISNLEHLVDVTGIMELASGTRYTIPAVGFGSSGFGGGSSVAILVNATDVQIMVGTDRSTASGIIVLYYTKSAPATNTRKKSSK